MTPTIRRSSGNLRSNRWLVGAAALPCLLATTGSPAPAVAARFSFENRSVNAREWQRHLAVCDLNRDGVDDILVYSDIIACPWPALSTASTPCTARPHLYIFPGGAETGSTRLEMPSGSAGRMVCGDLNADGWPDVVSAFPRSLAVRHNNGDGTLGPARSLIPRGPWDAAIADATGDGVNDLWIMSGNRDSVWIYPGGADELIPTHAIPLGAQIVQMLVADYDSDSSPDLAVVFADGPPYRVGCWFSRGGGTFDAGPVSNFGSSRDVMTLGDFNGDGHWDLAASFGRAFLGDGEGAFALANSSVPEGPASDPLSLIRASSPGTPVPAMARTGAAADLDGDGSLDLVTSGPRGVFRIWAGRGDGSFEAPVEIAATESPWEIAVGRFSGDDRPDIVQSSYAGHFATVFMNRSVPTPVEVLGLSAAGEGGHVVIRWTVPEDRRRSTFTVYRQRELESRALTPARLSGRDRYEITDPDPGGAPVAYWLEEITRDGVIRRHGPVTVPSLEAPPVMILAPNWPNPFVDVTSFQLNLARPDWVRLEIFDSLGRPAAVLLDGPMESGSHVLPWQARRGDGEPLAAGVYRVRLRSSTGERVLSIVKSR